jgi:hypothetical protein
MRSRKFFAGWESPVKDAAIGRKRNNMKRIAIFAAGLLFAGCGASYQVGHEPDEIEIQQGYQEVGNRAVTLMLVDGTEYEGCFTALATDTLQFQWDDFDIPIFVTVGQVHSVTTHPDKVLPTFVGVIAGGALGAVIAYSTTPDRNIDRVINSPNIRDIAVGGGALLGAFIGGGIGSQIPSPTKVTFTRFEDPDIPGKSEIPIALIVPDISEKDGYAQCVSAGRIVRLPMEQVTIERTDGAVVIHASQKAILSRPPDSTVQEAPGYRAGARNATINVSTISADPDGFVTVVLGGKTIRLASREVKIEHTASGVKISTTPEVFRAAGLDLEQTKEH